MHARFPCLWVRVEPIFGQHLLGHTYFSQVEFCPTGLRPGDVRLAEPITLRNWHKVYFFATDEELRAANYCGQLSTLMSRACTFEHPPLYVLRIIATGTRPAIEQNSSFTPVWWTHTRASAAASWAATEELIAKHQGSWGHCIMADWISISKVRAMQAPDGYYPLSVFAFHIILKRLFIARYRGCNQTAGWQAKTMLDLYVGDI